MDSSIRGVTSEATIEEKKKLRKSLRLFDMIFFTAAAIIGLDTLGAVSSNGGQADLVGDLRYHFPCPLWSAHSRIRQHLHAGGGHV